MTDDTPEGFLGRWSRTKRAAAQSVPDPEIAPPPPQESQPDLVPAPQPEPLSQEELDALPRIEDLIEGSDIRAFLRAGVPRQLRNAAMRRMWMLTPAIRDYSDPAVDYAWDWNTPGGVPGDGVGPSPEKAAKMFQDILKPRHETPAATDQPPSDAALTAEQAPADTPPADAPEEVAVAVPDKAQIASDDPAPMTEAPPRRRHGSALPG
jgi:hypothetical protein